MKKATSFTGYFKKIFLLFLIFIIIPIVIILFVYLGVFSDKIKENYIESQARTIQTLTKDLDGFIDIIAETMPEEDIISILSEQVNSVDDTMDVNIMRVGSDEYYNISNLKESLPKNQALITGTFYNFRYCYTIIVTLSDEEIGLDHYTLIVISVSIIITVILIILAWAISKRLSEPVKSMYQAAIDAGRGYKKLLGFKDDEMTQLSFIFEEMNHDARVSDGLIDNYKSAISAYSLALYLEGNITRESFFESNQAIPENGLYSLIAIKLQNTDMTENYIINLSDILEKFLGNEISKVMCPLRKGTLLILISSADRNSMTKLIRNLYDTIDSISKVRYIMACSNIIENFSELQNNAVSLRKLVRQSEFYNLCRTIVTEDVFINNTKDMSEEQCENYANRIKKDIISCDPYAITKDVDELFGQLRYIDITRMKQCYDLVVNKIVSELSLKEKLGLEIFNAAQNHSTFDDYKSRCLMLFKKASELYSSSSINPEKNICMNAVEYLHNYYFTDIDFTELAAKLSLSYSYLSRIFKSNMNITLTDYLNTYRIEQSCRLLETTDEKLDSIALKVGYNNSQSFQRFFKKYKGITPTEYRKMIITRKAI